MIKIYNDGKEKVYSWEASYENPDAYLVGFGDSEEQAIKNLKEKILLLTNELESINYSKIKLVNSVGKDL